MAKTCLGLKGSRRLQNFKYVPFEKASKIILIDVEFILFHCFESEILWIKGGSGIQTGGTPPEPVWHPLLTWRRVLRTTSHLKTYFATHSFDHNTPAFNPPPLLLYELSCSNGSRGALRVIAKSPLCVSAAKSLLNRPSGLAYALKSWKFQHFHHVKKSILQQISVLSISIKMSF